MRQRTLADVGHSVGRCPLDCVALWLQIYDLLMKVLLCAQIESDWSSFTGKHPINKPAVVFSRFFCSNFAA